MQLKEDEYILQLGGFLRIRSRSKAAEDMGRGRAKKDREDPDWRKRCHVSPEWSVEDRRELSAKVKAAWAKPEMAAKREAAKQRLLAWRKTHIQSDHAREVTRDRMLMGGAKEAVAARKIMQPEAVAAREERDAMIVRNYYAGKMKATEIAKLYNLEISWVYRILRTVQMD